MTGDCVFINRSRSKVVGADVVARVGGLDLVSTPAFPSSMSKSSETFVIRGCDGPALVA